MNKVWQEFYCGNCNGYFTCGLNIEIDWEALIVCPNCQHEHRRCINKGAIEERGRFNANAIEHVYPPKSAYSKEPKTQQMLKASTYGERRDGAVIKKKKDMVAAQIMNQSWFEHFGGKDDE